MKSNVSRFVAPVFRLIRKHSPEVLTGVGIAGMLGSVILAVRATPKAVTLIEEKNAKTPVEAVKACWTNYIPAAITFACSTACLVGASATNLKRNAALATAYSLSETALKEYTEKTREVVGEKKEREIKDKIARDKIQENPLKSGEVIPTGKGETLCYDAMSGRYFKSDHDRLGKAENRINRQLICDMYVSLNDFYDEIGLPQIKIGDSLGWNVNRAMMELQFSSQLTEDGTPCLVVGFANPPVYEYDRY